MATIETSVSHGRVVSIEYRASFMTGVCEKRQRAFVPRVRLSRPPKIAADSRINRLQDAQRLALALINNINSISTTIAFTCIR